MNCARKMLAVLIAAAVFAAGAGLAAGQEASRSPRRPRARSGSIPKACSRTTCTPCGWLSTALLTWPICPSPCMASRTTNPARGRSSSASLIRLATGRWCSRPGDSRGSGEGRYSEGEFTAFNFGLAAGTQIIDRAPVPPINYLLATDQGRFSTGFGEVVLYRPVEIRAS